MRHGEEIVIETNERNINQATGIRVPNNPDISGKGYPGSKWNSWYNWIDPPGPAE